jgi:hypothetical protein
MGDKHDGFIKLYKDLRDSYDISITQRSKKRNKFSIKSYRSYEKRKDVEKIKVTYHYLSDPVKIMEQTVILNNYEWKTIMKEFNKVDDMRIEELDEENIYYVADPKIEKMTIYQGDASIASEKTIVDPSLWSNLKTLRVQRSAIKNMPTMKTLKKISCRSSAGCKKQESEDDLLSMGEKFPSLYNLKIQCEEPQDARSFPATLKKLTIVSVKNGFDTLVKLLQPNIQLKKLSCRSEPFDNSLVEKICLDFPNLTELSLRFSLCGSSTTFAKNLSHLDCLSKLKISGINDVEIVRKVSELITSLSYLKIVFGEEIKVTSEILMHLSRLTNLKKIRLNQLGDGSFIGDGKSWPSLISIGDSVGGLFDNVTRLLAISNIERSLRLMSYFRLEVDYHYQKKTSKWILV